MLDVNTDLRYQSDMSTPMPSSSRIRHPGEILEEEFLMARSLSQYRVAVDTGVPPRRINEIVLGKRGITADTALRLARYFDNDPLYWMQLQSLWDLQRARERLGPRLAADVRGPGRTSATRHKAGPPADKATPEPMPEPTPKPTSGPELADHLL
jgi:addiction module HigA family antidote